MKLKRAIIIFATLFCFSAYTGAQENHFNESGFIISGYFEKCPRTCKVYLVTQEKDTVAKATAINGRFVFKGKLPLEGRFLFILFDSLITKTASKALFVTNNRISVDGIVGSRDIEVTGSLCQDEYSFILNIQKYNLSVIKKFEKELAGLYDQLKIEKENERVQYRDSIQQKIDFIRKTIDDLNSSYLNYIINNWVHDHTNSYLAAYLLLTFANRTAVDSAFLTLNNRVKSSYYGNELGQLLTALNTAREGKTIPNFFIIDTNQKRQSILEIAAKNKLTLIDCWASWCKPCRAEIPFLKKVYADYASKGFNIIGISSDKSVSAWKKALIEDGTKWDQRLQDKEINVSKLFGISAIPAYILIDNEGRLIAFDCAMSSVNSFGGSLREEALYKKLEEILSKQ